MILLSAIFGRICTTPIANVWLGPIGSLTPLRQYHVQDGSGGYRYSFTGPYHAKSESSSNGITQGGKSSRLPLPEGCFDCWRFHRKCRPNHLIVVMPVFKHCLEIVPNFSHILSFSTHRFYFIRSSLRFVGRVF